VSNNPRVAVLNGIGLAELRIGSFRAAEEAFIEALGLDAHQPRVIYNKALSRFLQNDLSGAKTAFVEAVEEARSSNEGEALAMSLYMSAVILKKQDEYGDAYRLAFESWELGNKSDYDTSILLSGIRLSQRIFDEAENWARTAITINKDDGDGHYNLACALSLQGKPVEEIQTALNDAYRLNPGLRSQAVTDSDLDYYRKQSAL